MPDTTDATKPCRNHPHHCPGCGKEIECGYACCATCTPPGVAAYEALLVSVARPDLAQQLATLTAERDRLHHIRAEETGKLAGWECPDCGFPRMDGGTAALRQQLQAARKELDEKPTMEDVVREVLCRAFPDGTELIPAFYAWYVPSQWLWWGRALGAFIGMEAAKRQAEVWGLCRPYMDHKANCAIPDWMRMQDVAPECTCGFIAALRQRKGEG